MCILFLLKSINFSYEDFKIKYKIDEDIITNYDIYNERDYLIFLRPNLKELSNKEILEMSKNSLIREIIKKKELNRIFKNLPNDDLMTDMKAKLMNYSNVSNEDELRNKLIENNLDYNLILEKLKYESLWNELIFKKFSSLVKVNEKNLRSELEKKISNIKKYEYNLSELLFEVEANETLDMKYKKIKEYISAKGFKNATYTFSISNSSNNGGEIGWVKETLLSDELSKIFRKMQKGQLTKPLKYPNGYLLIKINDIRDLKEVIDIEKELKELVQYETRRQLNQYSILYYKKLKQNTSINEYQ